MSVGSVVDSPSSVWEVVGYWEMMLKWGRGMVYIDQCPREAQGRGRVPHSVCVPSPAREGGCPESRAVTHQVGPLESRAVTHQAATAHYKYPETPNSLGPDSILARAAPIIP